MAFDAAGAPLDTPRSIVDVVLRVSRAAGKPAASHVPFEPRFEQRRRASEAVITQDKLDNIAAV